MARLFSLLVLSNFSNRLPEVGIKRQGVSVWIVQRELARAPGCVTKLGAVVEDILVAILGIERIGIVDVDAQAERAHLVRVLELHVQLDTVAEEAHVLGGRGAVAEFQLEPEPIDVERDGPVDVACTEDRIDLAEEGHASSKLASR